jgi:Peptidase family M1 domain
MNFHSRLFSPVAIFATILALPTLLRADQPTPVSYQLIVAIAPADHTISVRGTIDVPLKDPHTRELRFNLHETFAITQLRINGRTTTFSFEPTEHNPMYPASHKVAVLLPEGISGGMLHLEIAYNGRLTELPEFGVAPDQQPAMDDQINSRMVELANYSNWYPQFFEIGYPLHVDLQVSLPAGWTAICSGKKLGDRVDSGLAITRWSSPKDIDILIAAAPNYQCKSVRDSGVEIEVYYTQLPDAFIDKELHQIAEVMTLFTSRLGETTVPANTVKHVFSPKHKGQGRAGISRPGMIVTSEGLVREQLAADPNFSLFQDIAHEIGHFWWNFGAGQGDWINEAFAEYYSAFAVQKIVSQQQFESLLEKYRHEVCALPADAPPLAQVPFDGAYFVIRYYKGSLLVDYLRQSLGDDRFFQASREFFQTYRGHSIATSNFRDFWGQQLPRAKPSVSQWLDSPGSTPIKM